MAYLLSNELTTAVIRARQQQAVAAASARLTQSGHLAMTRVLSPHSHAGSSLPYRGSAIQQRGYSARSSQVEFRGVTG
jgi:hypothetical protein